jgi:hypothetical protein
MAGLLQHKKILFLAFILLAVAVANLWLFVPRFLFHAQMMTEDELRTTQQSLVYVARESADFSSDLSKKRIDQSARDRKFTDLVRRTDDAVLSLQTTEHVTTIDEQVKDTLHLAQIISFTLRDLQIQPDNWGRAEKAAIVLRQAAQSAEALADGKPVKQTDEATNADPIGTATQARAD